MSQTLRYRRMLAGLKSAGEKVWSVYVLRCGNGTLYTGIAKDVNLRLMCHQAGKGAAYTRTHLPVILLYKEEGFSRSEALKREAAIKRLTRAKKELLVKVQIGRTSL